MTPEVKKRIEQIRQGIVPEGYKKGKIGIVPIKWNEVPFSTLFTSTSEYTDDLKQYPLYSLTIEDGITAKTERYERSHLVKKENSYKVVRPNDYAYNPMNIRFGAVARHKGDIPVAVSGYYDIFTTVHKSDLVFMDSFLTCGPMITYYNKVSTGSLIEKQRVHFSDFLEFSLALPPLEERKKIAEILATQDKAIELQARKIEELKRFKKGCLEKMFPRKGQKVPEKRFPGFMDDWERRKLGSIYEAIGNAFVGTATPYYVENGHFYLESNNIKDGQINHNTEVFINDEFYEKQKDKWLHTGDMVMVQSGHVGHAAVIPEELDNSAAHALIMFRHPKIEIEPYFLNYQYQTLKSKKKIENITTGNTIKHILASDMQQFEVDMPKLEERKKIAEYFRGLDRLIALHQCKLEEMKRQKKALMQLLLTGIVRVRL